MNNYVSDSDQLILEDEIQRIRLVGNIDTLGLVTGVVAGLLGVENDEGKFEVDDICFPYVQPCPEKPLPINDEL